MSDHSHGPEAAYRRWGYAAEREQQRANRAVADLFPDVKPPPEIEDGDQRFTLESTDLWARKVANVVRWDLDVAACAESHLAARYYTKADDGLTKPWDASTIWVNPPFSDIEPWVQKAWREFERRSRSMVIAMLLPASRTEQRWWQELVEPHRGRQSGFTTHFLPGRTRFGLPGNPKGDGVGSPPFGCVLLVWRRT